ncbi:MAG: restriction endonuclease [Pseudodesulfovibrio sp.]|nr:restriction endonuclease [Pseudodesulfovibrio sp.]
MLREDQIITLLESLHEHKMAKDIFVQTLKAKGLKGVRFTGGPDEIGIDLEYYTLSEPDNEKQYHGIQFKMGDLKYGSGGGKNTVKEVKNQAEEAFAKEIHDLDGRSKHFISRCIIAITGDFNENARKMVGKARNRGESVNITFWRGEKLAEMIQENWMDGFEKYFKDQIKNLPKEKEEDVDENIVNAEYIESNYPELIEKCQKVRSTISGYEWGMLTTLTKLSGAQDSSVELGDFLFEFEASEENLRQEFETLIRAGHIDFDDGTLGLSGHAMKLDELYSTIFGELDEAEEDLAKIDDLFDKCIG